MNATVDHEVGDVDALRPEFARHRLGKRAQRGTVAEWRVDHAEEREGPRAAGHLAQMQATEALLEARKFDAFNRMSAFVVHDLKNIVDLLRYLFPMPVPQRWRRRMIALGSGHATRIICSALIAQAFESVRFPILPKITRSETAAEEILEIRHSSLYAPRDFDISPYFEVVKPTVVRGFDYRAMNWSDTAGLEAPENLIPPATQPATLTAA